MKIIYDFKIFFFLLTINLLNYSCYTASASLLHKDTHTVYIPCFTNQSNIINPFIGRDISLKLQDKFLENSNLNLVDHTLADIIIIGKIVSYNFILKNTSILSNTTKKNEYSIYNRLKINLHITYKSKKEPNKNFNKVFSDYIDFEGPKIIDHSIIQYKIIPLLIEKLVNQIFNKITINW